MPRWTDFAYERDAEGVYDLALDADTRDAAVTAGLDSAILISIHSDRRAESDEVADPMLRRGWICDPYSDIPDDRHGSGAWLYEQRRLTDETTGGITSEVEASLGWMIADHLATSVEASVTSVDPARRKMSLKVAINERRGGNSVRSFDLWLATVKRQITNTV
jgi:phage gp46-like protein